MKLDEVVVEAARAAGPHGVFALFCGDGAAVAVQHGAAVIAQSFDAAGRSRWVVSLECGPRETDFADVDAFLQSLATEDEVRIASVFEESLVLHGRGLLTLGAAPPVLDDTWLPEGAGAIDFPFRTANETCRRRPQFVLRVDGELWVAADADDPGTARRLYRLPDATELTHLLVEADAAALPTEPLRRHRHAVWCGTVSNTAVVVSTTRLRSGSTDHVIAALGADGLRAAATLPACPPTARFFNVDTRVVMTRPRGESVAWNASVEPDAPPRGPGQLIGGAADGRSLWLDTRKGEMVLVDG